MWNRRLPEFACAANSVSLLMPYVEPYVVRSVRTVLSELDGELRVDAAAYVRQEAQHHAQHRRFNDLLVVRYPSLHRVERWMDRTYGWLERTRTAKFNTAFAAGFEAIAFAAARWVDARADRLFDGADNAPASLLLWHLAEEVEHKSVAFDVFEKTDGSRRRYVGAMLVSLILFGVFSVLATLCMLASERRIFHPIAHLRLLGWTVTFVFVLLPLLGVSATKSHHPSLFADPPRLTQWLREQDAFESHAGIDDVLPVLNRR